MRVREVTAPDLEVEARARRPTENVVLRKYDSSYSMPVSEATVSKEVGQFEYYTQHSRSTSTPVLVVTFRNRHTYDRPHSKHHSHAPSAIRRTASCY